MTQTLYNNYPDATRTARPMIVTCEQCHARYLVASLKLGDHGRKVRCGVCSHTWFQDPVVEKTEEPQSFRDHIDHEILEPIPESVRPLPEGSTMPAVGQGRKKFDPSAIFHRDVVHGSVSALVVFLIIFAMLAIFHGPLARAWPQIGEWFNAIGLDVPAAGEGLVFDAVAAKAIQDPAGKSVLTVSGMIKNNSAKTIHIPALQAVLKKSAADAGSTFPIPLDKKDLAPAGLFPFIATFQNLPESMTQVTIQFAPQ